MLTPAQLKQTRLNKLDGGFYIVEEVDRLLTAVTRDYEQIFNENGNLVRKLGVLASKLEEYRKDENVLRDVLLNAQKSADLIIETANIKAQDIVQSANNSVEDIMKKGDGIIEDANRKASKITEAAESEYQSIISSAKVMADGYLSAARESAANVTSDAEKSINELMSGCDEKAAQIVEDAKIKAQTMLEEARTNADRMVAEATEEASRTRDEAVVFAADTKKEAEDYSEKVKAQAQDYADVTKADADNYARSINEEAEKTSEQIKADADSYARSINEEAEKASAQTDTLVADSILKAKEITEEATLKTEKIIEEAKIYAAGIIADAEAKVGEYEKLKLDDAQGYIDSVKAQADEKLSETDSYCAEIKTKTNAEAENIIADARNRAQEIINDAMAKAKSGSAAAEQKANAALADVDRIVEAKLSEAKEQSRAAVTQAVNDANAKIETAQKNADEILSDAKEKAAAMLYSANTECERMKALSANLKVRIRDMMSQAENNYNTIRERTAVLRANLEKQVNASRDMLTAQQSALNVLPEFESEDGLHFSIDAVEEPVQDGINSEEILDSFGLNSTLDNIGITLQDDSSAGDFDFKSSVLLDLSEGLEDVFGDVKTDVGAMAFSDDTAVKNEGLTDSMPEVSVEDMLSGRSDFSADEGREVRDFIEDILKKAEEDTAKNEDVPAAPVEIDGFNQDDDDDFEAISSPLSEKADNDVIPPVAAEPAEDISPVTQTEDDEDGFENIDLGFASLADNLTGEEEDFDEIADDISKAIDAIAEIDNEEKPAVPEKTEDAGGKKSRRFFSKRKK